eukprot:7971167-Alexandrium_andersonii.AAC.1
MSGSAMLRCGGAPRCGAVFAAATVALNPPESRCEGSLPLRMSMCTLMPVCQSRPLLALPATHVPSINAKRHRCCRRPAILAL